MSELASLKATARPRAGKGAARQSRRDGNVPAVIYGDNQTPETIAIEYNLLWKQVIKGHFTSTAFELDVDGKKHIVLARDLQEQRLLREMQTDAVQQIMRRLQAARRPT